MPYIATKPRKIAGRVYARGEAVDTSALTVAKIASMVRVGLLIQDDQAILAGIETKDEPEPEAVVEAVEEEAVCPVCGAGPFKRLDKHMARHEEESD